MQRNPDDKILSQCAGKCPPYMDAKRSAARYIMYKRAEAEAVKRGLINLPRTVPATPTPTPSIRKRPVRGTSISKPRPCCGKCARFTRDAQGDRYNRSGYCGLLRKVKRQDARCNRFADKGKK